MPTTNLQIMPADLKQPETKEKLIELAQNYFKLLVDYNVAGPHAPNRLISGDVKIFNKWNKCLGEMELYFSSSQIKEINSLLEQVSITKEGPQYYNNDYNCIIEKEFMQIIAQKVTTMIDSKELAASSNAFSNFFSNLLSLLNLNKEESRVINLSEPEKHKDFASDKKPLTGNNTNTKHYRQQ